MVDLTKLSWITGLWSAEDGYDWCDNNERNKKRYKNKVRRDMSEKQKYIDFEAYERVAEPHKRERVSAWRTAIGL